MFETMNIAILVGASLVIVSTLTSVISLRAGAPLLLVFLLIGLAAGVDGPGNIAFDDARAAYFIGSIALAIILFDSGFDTRFGAFRVAAAPAITLATLGVLLTAGLAGVAAHFLLGLRWIESLLMGSIIASTDAAAVFLLLRVGGIRLRDRVRSTLEIESGSNDPMAIFLTISLVELLAEQTPLADVTGALALRFALQIGVGGAAGGVAGWLIVEIVNRLRLESALYPIVVLAAALLLFAAVSMAGGSGFLAVYIAGLVVGNARSRHTAVLRRFQSGMTWLSQISMFLTLGLLATPSEFPDVLPAALGIAIFLILLGRPLVVWLCLLPFGFSRREVAFIAWVGLRGAVSILLGIMPVIGGLWDGQVIFNTAFIIVLVSLLVQGWTIRPMARWLGIVVPAPIGPVNRVDLELPDVTGHEIVAYRIHADSAVARGERIPRWARPSLIVREGRSMRVHNAGRLRPGDQVYIIAIPAHVPLLDRLFAGPSSIDAEDRLIYGDFVLNPDAAMNDVAATYGLDLRDEHRDRSAAEILYGEFGLDIEIGDRLACGPIDLIVRGMDDEHRITSIGIAVEHDMKKRPGSTFFR